MVLGSRLNHVNLRQEPELAQGAGGPGVDLEVRRKRVGGRVVGGGAGGEGKVGEGVEGAGAVEEFEVEGGGGLAVDFAAGAGLHGHFFAFLGRVLV